MAATFERSKAEQMVDWIEHCRRRGVISDAEAAAALLELFATVVAVTAADG